MSLGLPPGLRPRSFGGVGILILQIVLASMNMVTGMLAVTYYTLYVGPTGFAASPMTLLQIETFTQSVAEVWVDNRLSEILVTDTTQQLETEDEFISTHSTHEPVSRKLTAYVTQIQREYPYSPLHASAFPAFE